MQREREKERTKQSKRECEEGRQTDREGGGGRSQPQVKYDEMLMRQEWRCVFVCLYVCV